MVNELALQLPLTLAEINALENERAKRLAVSALRRGGSLVVCDGGRYRHATNPDDVKRCALPIIKHGLAELRAARSMLGSQEFAEMLGQQTLDDLVGEFATAGKNTGRGKTEADTPESAN